MPRAAVTSPGPCRPPPGRGSRRARRGRRRSPPGPAAAATVFETATSVTSAGSRPARAAAVAIRSRTREPRERAQRSASTAADRSSVRGECTRCVSDRRTPPGAAPASSGGGGSSGSPGRRRRRRGALRRGGLADRARPARGVAAAGDVEARRARCSVRWRSSSSRKSRAGTARRAAPAAAGAVRTAPAGTRSGCCGPIRRLAAPAVEAGGDDGDHHLFAEALVEARPEDDVRLGIGRGADLLGGLGHLPQGEVRGAGDVEQDPLRAGDVDLEQRAGDGLAGGLEGAVLAAWPGRCPSAPSRRPS